MPGRWVVSHAWFSLTVFYFAHGATREYVFETDYFKFNPDSYGEVWMQGINRQIPGPEIRVRNGDRLKVTLVNKCQTEELTIHWHGLEMRTSQEYDGVYGLTMCAVQPGHSFVYEFDINEVAGTYMYHEHAHLEHVAGRGFFGPLIIEDDHNLWSNELANQACGDCEAVLSIFDYWPASQEEIDSRKVGRIVRSPMVSAQGNGVGLLPFHNLLINGKGAFNVFGNHQRPDNRFVTDTTRVSDLFDIVPTKGQTWRLRIINMGALFAFRFRIDHHRLKVIATDGGDVEPYLCDAITLSAGERFDVLVTFDQDVGSYWMRAETLEEGFGIHHGQLAVLRYDGAALDVLPEKGFPIQDFIRDHPSLVTLNCVDQAKASDTCLPITVLRRNAALRPGGSHAFNHIGHADDETHDFEVALRGFAGEINTHMTRLLDLKDGGNPYGENQFEGPYTQFAPPKVPYPYVGGAETHENTLVMRLSMGETVRVVLQWQDRAAHPWHLHGHKFAVLAFGFPDYETDCDLVYCRSKSNHWITRDGAIQANGKFTSFGRKLSDDDKTYSTRYPTLLDPDEAPLKDTLHLPAGGWAVIQFKADNPGWWFFHCHMLVHMADGMALVVEEARDQMPARLFNTTYLDEKGFPSCSKYVSEYEETGMGKSCDCWQNPEMKWDNWPRSSYKCTTDYLCGQELLNPLDPKQASREKESPRRRQEGWPWRMASVAFWLFIAGLLFLTKARHDHIHKKRHRQLLHKFLSEGEQFATNVGKMAGDVGKMAVGNVASLLTRAQTTHQVKAAAYAAHNARQLFQQKEVKERQEEYHVTLEFLACRGSREKTPAVKATLEPGSVMMVLGTPENTQPWIKFLAARRSPKIRGNLKLGGEQITEWDRRELRQVIGYIPRTVVSGRANVYVLEILNLYMNLGCSKHVHSTREAAARHRDRLIALFHLHDHLSEHIGNLSPAVLLRVNLARELLLPRSVLVLEDPFESLEFRHARKVMKMLKAVSEHMKVTVILSSEHCVCEVGSHATHGMIVVRDFTTYGPRADLEAFCTLVGRVRKSTLKMKETDVFERCSYLIEKSAFDDLFEINEAATKTEKALIKSSTQVLGLDTSGLANSPGAEGEDAPKLKFFVLKQEVQTPTSETTENFVPRPSNGTGRETRKSNVRNSRSSDTSSESRNTHRSSAKISNVGTVVKTQLQNARSVLEEIAPAVRRVSKQVEKAAGKTIKPPREHKSILYQIGVLTRFELLRGFKESITIYKLIETLGIGCVACMVWWRKGSVDTQTSLGEVVGLLFFTTALWSLPPIFQALTAMPGILSLVTQEFGGGLYNLYTFVVANFIASAFTLCAIWPPLWQSIAYFGAEVGHSLGHIVQMKAILILNVLTMRTMGLVLALIVPSQQTNVVIGNIIGQFCLLTNGFYTRLPDSFVWVTHFSIPRYTLKALLKLEFAWDDTFLVNPMTGSPNFGFPTMYIPAQLTGMFQTLETRGMDIMTSYEDADPLPEMLTLIGITLCFQVIFAVGMFVTIRTLEAGRVLYDESSFHTIGSWQELLDESTRAAEMPPTVDAEKSDGLRLPKASLQNSNGTDKDEWARADINELGQEGGPPQQVFFGFRRKTRSETEI